MHAAIEIALLRIAGSGPETDHRLSDLGNSIHHSADGHSANFRGAGGETFAARFAAPHLILLYLVSRTVEASLLSRYVYFVQPINYLTSITCVTRRVIPIEETSDRSSNFGDYRKGCPSR